MSIIFNKASGKIEFTSEFPIRDSERDAIKANGVLDCIDGFVSKPDKYYVLEGAIIAIPDRPHALAEWDWNIHEWVMPATDIVLADMAKTARKERDRLLSLSDWTQLQDTPDAVRQGWARYRKELRDIPSQPGFPITIVWPSEPS